VIEKFAQLIPTSLAKRSGSVFYSGRNAFSSRAELYMLGANPGGSPDAQASETISWHTEKVLAVEPANWSAYRDESWRNAAPGTSGMQPRVLHVLSRVGLEPGSVPASNVVFIRSTRESTLDGNYKALAEECWPFHSSVIEKLKPKVILCFGHTAGDFVRQKLRANQLRDQFVERNGRRWISSLYSPDCGPAVIAATHPSIANWRNANCDPSAFVVQGLSM